MMNAQVAMNSIRNIHIGNVGDHLNNLMPSTVYSVHCGCNIRFIKRIRFEKKPLLTFFLMQKDDGTRFLVLPDKLEKILSATNLMNLLYVRNCGLEHSS